MGKRYHYTYRVKFPDTGHFYFGLHSTKNLDDGYSGSPVTHKWRWDFYEYELEILEFFESRDEAIEVERRLILPTMNHPLSLNSACGGVWSLDTCVRAGSLGGGSNKKRVEVTTPTGEVMTFDSCVQAGKALGFPYRMIARAASGHSPHHKHYTARYT